MNEFRMRWDSTSSSECGAMKTNSRWWSRVDERSGNERAHRHVVLSVLGNLLVDSLAQVIYGGTYGFARASARRFVGTVLKE